MSKYGIRRRVRKIIYGFAAIVRSIVDHTISEKRREKLREVILFTDSPAGRRFDKFIILLIVISVLIVILETMPEMPRSVFWAFFGLEWVITIIFTVEYLARIYVARNPVKYVFSFYGLVDLLAFIPSYLSVFFFGSQHLLIIRMLRLLRIFRIFKLGHFVTEGGIVVDALRASKIKIYVFLSFIVLISTLIGSIMYMVEHPYNESFRSIPNGIYWAIVTITTVGYGDVIPHTPVGRILSTVVMILGYMVLAVPTGIVTAEISNRVLDVRRYSIVACRYCGETKHVVDPTYCHNCGTQLVSDDEED